MAIEAAAVAFVAGAVVCLGTSWVLVSKLEMVGERFGFSEAVLGLVAALDPVLFLFCAPDLEVLDLLIR